MHWLAVSVIYAVKRIIKEFSQTGSTGDTKHIGGLKTNRTNVIIEAVSESAGESPETSIRHL